LQFNVPEFFIKWLEEEIVLLSHWVISVFSVTATVIGGN
jgi:hypothetical protein